MSLKENLNAVKEELSAEEQFLESVIKAEGFWKKYKKIIISIALILFLVIAARLIMEYLHNKAVEASNRAYAKVLQNPDDKESLKILKEKNPRLYEAYLFSQTIKSNDPKKIDTLISNLSDPYLKDLSSYQIDSLLKKGLDEYSQKEDAILKELAIYQSGYLLIKEGKIKEGRAKLAQIQKNSPLYGLAQNLSHYRGKN